MSNYVGIPVKVFIQEDNGECKNWEILVFATIRRCPALGGLLKKISKLDVKEDACAMRSSLARKKLIEATTEEEIAVAEELAVKAVEESEQATADLAASVREFVVQGFIGAGYTEEAANRNADIIPTEKIRELKAAALVGSGKLDFTKAQAE